MAMGLITGDMAEMLRLSQMVIDVSDSDPAAGNFYMGAPLAYAYAITVGRVGAHMARRAGDDDFHRALMMSRNTDPTSQSAVVTVTYGAAIQNGVILADDVALRDIQEALDTAERSADDLALGYALLTMGARSGGEKLRCGGPRIAVAAPGSRDVGRRQVLPCPHSTHQCVDRAGSCTVRRPRGGIASAAIGQR